MTNTLMPDQTLSPDQEIASNNGKVTVVMQGDGNFVLYENMPNGRRPLWSSDTWNVPGSAGSRVVMQADGNLVVYTSTNKPIWSSDTWNKPGSHGSRAVLQDDGNFVIYTAANEPIWASNTSVGGPISIAAEWRHPNGFHMRGDGYLTKQGQLRADITTWSTSWGLGFTGGCLFSVMDSNENVIHKWQIWPLGVDGRAIWWRRSTRTDHLESQIDPADAAKASRIALDFSHMPKVRLDEIMTEVHKTYEDIKKFFDAFTG